MVEYYTKLAVAIKNLNIAARIIPFDVIEKYFLGDDTEESEKEEIFYKEVNNFAYDVLELPNSFNFINLQGKPVFVRGCYSKLVELIYNYYDKPSLAINGIVLTGSPGIGKSVGALNYILWDASKRKKFVVFESIKIGRTVCFDFRTDMPTGYAYAGRPTDYITPELQDRNATIYLVDPGTKNSTLEPIPCLAFTVVAASPNKNHYAQFVKGAVVTRVLSAWSKLECIQLAYEIGTDLDLVKKGLKNIATTPCNLLCGISEKLDDVIAQRDEALSMLSQNPNDLVSLIKSDGKIGIHSLDHRLFNIYSDPTTFKIVNITYGCNEIKNKIAEIINDWDDAKLSELAFVTSPIVATLSGNFFEVYARKALANGGVFKVFFFFFLNDFIKVSI
jgi:hypothetical protein